MRVWGDLPWQQGSGIYTDRQTKVQLIGQQSPLQPLTLCIKSLVCWFYRLCCCCTLFHPASHMNQRLKVLRQHLALRCHASHLCSERPVLGLRCRGRSQRAGLLPAGLSANVCSCEILSACLSVVVLDPDSQSAPWSVGQIGSGVLTITVGIWRKFPPSSCFLSWVPLCCRGQMG